MKPSKKNVSGEIPELLLPQRTKTLIRTSNAATTLEPTCPGLASSAMSGPTVDVDALPFKKVC